MKKTNLTFSDIQQLHQQGQLEAARLGYLALLDTEPDNVTALHWLGVLYAEEGKLAEAKTCLNKAIQLSPSDPTLKLHLANF